MSYQSYKESEKRVLADDLDRLMEEVDIQGYAIVERVLADAEVT